MAYLSTGDEKERILRNDKDKVREEVRQMSRDVGLRDMVPLSGKNPYEQMEDLRDEGGHIRDIMDASKEKRMKKREEERKAKSIPMSRRVKMYFAQVERKAYSSYISRRILFRDGGFGEYVGRIRMMPYRVLLKEIPGNGEEGGIVIPDIHKDKYPRYLVLATGSGCDGVSCGESVLVEAYSGTEVVSGQERYRIVTIDDIICITEEN